MLPLEKEIIQHLLNVGGQPFITGGTVRDKLLGEPLRDTDVVVFGMDEDMLFRELKPFGQVLTYGKSFRVYQVRGIALEFSLPRNREGHGKMSMMQRLQRDAEGRDFTINALYMHPLSEEIKDPLQGLIDINMRRLRMTSRHTFETDPLRVLRAVQLSARMGLSVEEKTLESMGRVSLQAVAHERIYEELNKWLLGSDPARGRKLLSKTGHMPEMCQTEEKSSPVMDEVLTLAASLRNQSACPAQWMWGVLLAFCMLSEYQHHLGTDEGMIRNQFIRPFGQLSNHNDHTRFVDEILWGIKRIERDALRKADVARLSLGVNLDELILTMKALTPFWHHVGKEGEVHRAMHQIKKMRPQEKIRPLVKGIDLKEWGFKEGKAMGTLLQVAFQMQLEGVTKKEVERYFKKHHKVLQKPEH